MNEDQTETSTSGFMVKNSGLRHYFDSINNWLSNLLNIGHSLSDSIGIEINPDFIKLLKIENSHQTPTVEYFEIVPTPPQCIINNEIKDPQKLSQTLREIITRHKIPTKCVILSMPRASTIIKMIRVDSRLAPDEIESRVWLEAGRLFPNLVGDIYLDFVVSETPAPDDKNQVDVMLIACRKDQVRPYLEVMNSADLEPAVVDIDTYAFERALTTLIKRQEPSNKIWALLNISYNMITLIVTDQGNLIFSHEMAYDSRGLMKKIKESKEDNASSREEWRAFLSQTLGTHLRHSLQFFYSSRPHVRVDNVILGGDCVAMIPDFAGFVEKEINKEVKVANLFENTKVADRVDQSKLNQYAPALILCYGLATSKL